MEQVHSVIKDRYFSLGDNSPMRKILLLVGVAIVIFLTFTAYSVRKSIESSAGLSAVKELHFPVLERVDANIVRLDKMEESFMQSVMVGEPDLLRQAAEYATQADKALEEMARLYPEKGGDIAKIRADFEHYHQQALLASTSIFEKRLGDMHAQASRMNEALNQARMGIKRFRQSTYDNFVQNLAQLQQSARLSLYLGTALGVMNLCFMGVLVFFIGSNMKMMRVIAEQNITLEHRVAARTEELVNANQSLRVALDNLNMAKDELVRSEKMAALGSLVAGVAHELNTPIGNALMIAKSLGTSSERFGVAIESGLKRSLLEEFVGQSVSGTNMLVLNLQRAADLIVGFKQIAVDQSSSHRRPFDLRETCTEISIALTPVLKKSPFRLINDIPPGIVVDGYPGPMGQIMINFVNNSLAHGFEGKRNGTMRFSIEDQTANALTLVYQDDGVGIPPNIMGRIFEPFFTTKLGQGGNGLGLHIVHNIATSLFGGSIQVKSEQGEGAVFRLTMPLSAPVRNAAADLPVRQT